MTKPLVSVVVPSFNQGRFIRETLDSILAQDYRPLEVLVLDGGSKDETVEVLHSFGDRSELQWWSEPDRGVVDAVNKGLTRARGEILAIQSSDDLYLPGAVTSAVAALGEDARPGLVFGDVDYIRADSSIFGGTSLPPFDLGDYAGKRTFIPQPAAFFTRAAMLAAGMWREDISFAADADFYLRIATRFPVLKIERRLARYRYHEDQRDRAGSRIARDWERAIRTWIKESKPSDDVRVKALAGIHLTRAHYMSDDQWFRRTGELYLALMRTPDLFRQKDFPRQQLIPGRVPLFRVLSKVKRALGFPARK